MTFYKATTPDGLELFIGVSENRVASFIADENNPDYQEYLAWVAEGNEAEPWA